MALENVFGALTLEETQQLVLQELQGLYAELQEKINEGGTVALDAMTLAALETINANLRDELGQPFTAENPLHVDVGANLNVTADFQSVVSTVNSRNTPLGANEAWQGVWEDVLNFAAITAAIFTDVSSAVDGAKIQFSADGVDILTEHSTTITGGVPGAFPAIPIEARYFRICYENGPVAQTVLEAQVSYSPFAPAGPISPLGAQVTDGDQASVTQAMTHGRHPSGLYIPLQVDEGGRLQVDVVAAPDDPGLTDDQLRASPIEVDTGLIVQTDALTDGELRASPVPVSGTVAMSNPTADPETGLATEATLAARFGVAVGVPVVVSNTTPVTLHDPPPGKKVRLKWIAFSTTSDEASLVATLRWAGGANIYQWPLGAVPAFAHGVVREGGDGQALEIALSVAADVYVNLDIEEVDA
jgi:hypothetical protein